MGSESTTSPNLTDENPQQQQQQPASEPVNQISGNGQATVEATTTREASPKSVFVNSEPIREEQVQNAVKFLSHPKVRGSPVMYRRSFLEKKGLSRDEIDEAFRRVPDPAPTVAATQPPNPNPDGQSNISSNLQPQVPVQTPQLAVAAPSGVVSTITTLRPAQFRWSHALVAIGFLAASGAGTALLFKNAVLPRLKSWIRKVVLEEENDSMKKISSKPSIAEEATLAAKSAAAAAADVAKSSQEILNSKDEERRYFEAFMNRLDIQVEEMKSMSSAIRKLEGAKEVTVSSVKQTEEVRSASRNVGPSSAAASMDPSVAPHPKSYMEIMAMVQRGEKPPGIKEINDLPPNPNQPPSIPRLAPRAKPWEVGQIQNGSYNGEASSTKIQDNLQTTQLNGDSTEPWWQRKNVRLTEFEPEDELKMDSYRATANERLSQRSWVPPQPPPIAMPEAAAAIRQLKTQSRKEQPDEDQLIGRPLDGVDELERITKISESGGELEINASAESQVNEIQEEL